MVATNAMHFPDSVPVWTDGLDRHFYQLRDRTIRALGDPGAGGYVVLLTSCDVDEATYSTRWEQLDVMPIGSVTMDPSEVIRASWLADFLALCRRRYTLTFIDAAPVMDSNTTTLLSAAADATILVIKAEHERWEVAQRAIGLMEDAGGRVIGAVLNKQKYHIPKFLYNRA